jgi:hypothetical protein
MKNSKANSRILTLPLKIKVLWKFTKMNENIFFMRKLFDQKDGGMPKWLFNRVLNTMRS